MRALWSCEDHSWEFGCKEGASRDQWWLRSMACADGHQSRRGENQACEDTLLKGVVGPGGRVVMRAWLPRERLDHRELDRLKGQ